MNKKLLVLRFSSLGDVLMSLPALKMLRQTYPELDISVASMPKVGFLFALIPNIIFIPVHTADFKGIFGLFRLFKILNQPKPSVVADIHNVLRTKVLDFFFRLNGTAVFQLKKDRKARKKIIANDPNKKIIPLKSMIQRYLDVFADCGFPVNFDKHCTFAPLPFPQNTQNFWDKQAKIHIGVAPFAKFESKEIPLNTYRELFKKYEAASIQFLIFGFGKAELERAQHAFGDCQNVNILIGKMDFEAEAALISHLDLMISLDSANGHLAALFGVKVLTIWTVTHPALGFAPYGMPEEYSLMPDRKQFPELPLSIYGKGYFPKIEAYRADITAETLADVVRFIL